MLWTSIFVRAADSPSLHAASRPKTVAERNIGPSDLRNYTIPSSPLSVDNSERTTRSSNNQEQASTPSSNSSWVIKQRLQLLGTSSWDNMIENLDSDDEAFFWRAIHFLRMPPDQGEDCDKFDKSYITSREGWERCMVQSSKVELLL